MNIAKTFKLDAIRYTENTEMFRTLFKNAAKFE